MDQERRMRRHAMRHEKVFDQDFEVIKTFAKAAFMLIFLVPVGIALAALIVSLL